MYTFIQTNKNTDTFQHKAVYHVAIRNNSLNKHLTKGTSHFLHFLPNKKQMCDPAKAKGDQLKQKGKHQHKSENDSFNNLTKNNDHSSANNLTNNNKKKKNRYKNNTNRSTRTYTIITLAITTTKYCFLAQGSSCFRYQQFIAIFI